MGIGMALVWSIRRPVGTAIIPGALVVSLVLDLIACAMIVCSIWLVLTAIRALGKQWNVRAMVVEDHSLITTGPYSMVRHPIYTGMFGLMVATGLANTSWLSLLAAIGIASVGTVIRLRQEEALLRDAFGAEYDAYRNRVPAFIPRL